MIHKDADIYSKWNKMPPPKAQGNWTLIQFQKTNLYILKNANGGFGFLITDTYTKLESDYKNIVSQWKDKIINPGNKKILNRCLIIESKENIDSKLFCSAISSLFEIQAMNHLFNINEIEHALKKIEQITQKNSDELNEIVGVWGELYLIDKLMEYTIKDTDKLQIIESWEGITTRTKIDFNFQSQKIKIEVKTTTESIRTHHFNGLEQVSKGISWNGYVASLCITPDEGGITCNDLTNSIKNKIPNTYLSTLDAKLNLRGKSCSNTIKKFTLNPSKNMEFFDFLQIPKPIIEEGIGKIEWNAILENKQFLDPIEKTKLLNIMN